MIPMRQFKNISEMLVHIAMDKLEWSHRDVKLVFNQKSEAWIYLYPQGDHTLCIDFAYKDEESPGEILENFFAIHSGFVA